MNYLTCCLSFSNYFDSKFCQSFWTTLFRTDILPRFAIVIVQIKNDTLAGVFYNAYFDNAIKKVVFNPLQLVAILLWTLLKPQIVQDGGQCMIQN